MSVLIGAKSGGHRPPQHLVVVHYHLRPGGVRRIIELALPGIVKAGGVERVTLLTGEAEDSAWNERVKAAVSVPLELIVERRLRYFSEQRSKPEVIRRSIEAALNRVVGEEGTLIWAQNPGLGRNMLLTSALVALSRKRRGVRLVFHHHDLWFENRWGRWPEMKACGFRTLDAVARVIFAPEAVHAAINRLDYSVLKKTLGRRAMWMPNLVEKEKEGRGRRWLAERLGDDSPVWMVPTRFLRRKNLAEAVLLTRWLRPEAWLVTTAGVSSEDERIYAERLEKEARRHRWKVRFRMLEDAGAGAPEIGELMDAAEAVLLTSVQEGFGLPYLEATAAGKPLIARSLPNVLPDLTKLGFSFPQLYREVMASARLFDLEAERERQERIWRKWRAEVPTPWRGLAAAPGILDVKAGEPVAFSRLTLTAQLEVLAHPAERSWAACRKWNPLLEAWRRRARLGKLAVGEWPGDADASLGAAAYAERFWRAVRADAGTRRGVANAEKVQREFIVQRLGREFLYPLLMGRE